MPLSNFEKLSEIFFSRTHKTMPYSLLYYTLQDSSSELVWLGMATGLNRHNIDFLWLIFFSISLRWIVSKLSVFMYFSGIYNRHSNIGAILFTNKSVHQGILSLGFWRMPYNLVTVLLQKCFLQWTHSCLKKKRSVHDQILSWKVKEQSLKIKLKRFGTNMIKRENSIHEDSFSTTWNVKLLFLFFFFFKWEYSILRVQKAFRLTSYFI